MQGPHVAPIHHCCRPKLDPVVVAFARIAHAAHFAGSVASEFAAAASARWPGDVALPQAFGHVSYDPFYPHLLVVLVTHPSACSTKTLAAAAAAAAAAAVVGGGAVGAAAAAVVGAVGGGGAAAGAGPGPGPGAVAVAVAVAVASALPAASTATRSAAAIAPLQWTVNRNARYGVLLQMAYQVLPSSDHLQD